MAILSAAAPVDDDEPRYLSKRDAVCAQDFRVAFNADLCLKGPNFALTPPSTITETASVATKPADSQCDHTVEIQFLDGALKRTLVCDLMRAVAKVSTAHSVAVQISPMAGIINGKGNLLFLDASVNNRKKTFITNAVKGNTNANDALNVAVKSFLEKSATRSDATVKELDTELAAIIKEAGVVSAANLPSKTSGRLPAADVPKAALVEALAAAKKEATAGILLSEWNKIFE